MKGDVFFPTTFSPTPPLPINKSQHDSPPSSPSSTPPSTPPYSSTSPSSLSSAFSSPTPAFSSPTSHYLSSSVPSNPSPFLSHSPPSSPSPTLPTTTVMATTLFLPPLTNTSTPFRSHVRRDQEEDDEEDDVEEEEEVDIDDDDVDIRDHDENPLSHTSLLSPYMHSNSISNSYQHRHSLPLYQHNHMRRAASDEAIYQRTSLSLGPSLGIGSRRNRQDEEDDDRHVVVDVHQHHDDVDVGVEDDDDVDDVEVEDVEIVEADDEEEEEEECQETEHHHLHQLGGVGVAVAVGAAAVGLEVATSMRRVTLKPRRTLSLSPTPARPGDMSMGRNLRAACWFDYTNKDDDDGLCSRPVDSDTESTAKRKTENDENGNLPDCPDKTTGGATTSAVAGGGSQPTATDTNGNTVGGSGGVGTGATPRFARRGLPLGASSSLPALSTTKRSSVKRPLEVTLPCQEIQYLDISYQKVGTNMVQFSPIPRKKIAYHPVLHHTIHYCEVSYCPNTNTNTERPIKRKPLGRSHSFAVSDLRERIDTEGNYKFR